MITSDINLGDILSRTTFSRKGTLRKYKGLKSVSQSNDVHSISWYPFTPPALCDLTLPKKKLKDERRKKKMRIIKVETEDPCETLAPSDSLAPPANIMNSLPDTPSTPLTNIKEE